MVRNEPAAAAITEPAVTEDSTEQDDTDELLDAGRKAAEQKSDVQTQIQDIYDQIDQMDKNALEQYAQTKYRIDLDKRKSVANLRDQVRQLIDQFGVV